jgi:hypothetical protein
MTSSVPGYVIIENDVDSDGKNISFFPILFGSTKEKLYTIFSRSIDLRYLNKNS